MSFIPFIIYSTAGSIIWVTLLTYAGYILGENYQTVGTYIKPISTVILVAIIAGFIYWIIKRKTRLFDN